MKILCKKCKSPVAYGVGKLVQIKRQEHSFSVVGDDYSVLASCPRNCGQQTAIIIERGKIKTDDLLVEDENNLGGKDGKRDESKDDRKKDGESGGEANGEGKSPE